MNNTIAKMDESYFSNIEILKGDLIFYHSCSSFAAVKILKNGFKGHLENLHGTIQNSELFDSPEAIVFASEEIQKNYGNTILEIRCEKAIKALHTEYNSVEILIELSDILEVSEYCN